MASRPGRSGYAGWLFLLAVAAVYALVALFDTAAVSRALVHFAGVMQQVLPALVGVFVLLLILNLLVSPQWVRRNLGRRSGLRAWVITLAGGVLAAGPVYPWYALLQDLRAKGMRHALAAVFLYSRAVKLPLLPFMVHYFGIAFTVVLCSYLVLFAVVNGLLMRRFDVAEQSSRE